MRLTFSHSWLSPVGSGAAAGKYCCVLAFLRRRNARSVQLLPPRAHFSTWLLCRAQPSGLLAGAPGERAGRLFISSLLEEKRKASHVFSASPLRICTDAVLLRYTAMLPDCPFHRCAQKWAEIYRLIPIPDFSLVFFFLLPGDSGAASVDVLLSFCGYLYRI